VSKPPDDVTTPSSPHRLPQSDDRPRHASIGLAFPFEHVPKPTCIKPAEDAAPRATTEKVRLSSAAPPVAASTRRRRRMEETHNYSIPRSAEQSEAYSCLCSASLCLVFSAFGMRELVAMAAVVVSSQACTQYHAVALFKSSRCGCCHHTHTSSFRKPHPSVVHARSYYRRVAVGTQSHS
jgi:hypothetical protein